MSNPIVADPPADTTDTPQQSETPAASWALPDALKDDAGIFETFKDKPIDDVLVAFRDLSKSAAANAIPATPKEYAVKPPVFPEGVQFNQEAFDAWLGQMHAANVPPAAVQALIDADVVSVTAEHEAAKVEIAKQENALKAEWGDKYPANVEAVGRVIDSLPPEMKQVIEDSGMSKHPHLVKLLHIVAAAREEGTLHTGDSGGGMTREQRMYPTMFPKK